MKSCALIFVLAMQLHLKDILFPHSLPLADHLRMKGYRNMAMRMTGMDMTYITMNVESFFYVLAM